MADSAPAPAVADTAAVLAQVSPFADLRPVDRAKLAAALEEVTYAEGTVIFAEGAPADGLYILREGLIERQAHGVHLALIEPPAVFGILALLRHESRSATLRAATRCVVWRLPADRFDQLLKQTPSIGARFAGAVSDQLADTREEVVRLAHDFLGLARRLYASLPPEDQVLVERSALLPRLDPRVVSQLLAQPGTPRAALPLADVLVVPDEEEARYPEPFRRFLLGRLEERVGPHGLGAARRELAVLARSAGAVDVAVEILVEGHLLADAAEIARHEADALERAGRGADAERLLALLPAGTAASLPALEAEAALAAAGEDRTAPATVAGRRLTTWRPGRRTLGLGLAALTLLGGWFLPPPSGLSVAGWHALLSLIALVPLLAFDAVPEGVAAIGLVALWVVTGTAPTRVAASGFASTGWMLVVSVLLIGAAIASSGLLYRLALWTVAHTRGGFGLQASVFALAGMLIGPANPNATGRVMLIAPAATDLVEALGYEPRSRAAAGLAMATLIGFGQMVAAFLTSSTTAVIVYALLPETSQHETTWLAWAARAAPATIILFVGMLAFIIWYYHPRPGDASDGPPLHHRREGIALQQALLGPATPQEQAALVVTIGILLGFITQPIHGINPAWVGVAGVVVLAATGVLTSDGMRNVNWSFALFYGILPSMAELLGSVGLDQWLAALISSALGGFASEPILFIAALTLLSYALSFVLRWQAAAPLLTIALMPVAQAAGIDPFVVALVTVIACAGFFLPYQSTTYLALYYGTGGRLFTHAQARPAALAYGVVTLIALCGSVPFWQAMGLIGK